MQIFLAASVSTGGLKNIMRIRTNNGLNRYEKKKIEFKLFYSPYSAHLKSAWQMAKMLLRFLSTPSNQLCIYI